MKEAIRSVEVFDWDKEGSEVLKAADFRLLDTTLRDGVQTPGINQPTLEQKLKIIDHDARLGIEAVDVCLPSDPKTRYFKEGVECAKYIRRNYPDMEIVVLTPTMQQNVESTLKFADLAGVRLSTILFRGSSDLRLLAEDWKEDEIVDGIFSFTDQLSRAGHKVICATEDSTRTRPEFLREIFEAGKEAGAEEFCIADTAGFADPVGIERQVSWVRDEIIGDSGLQIQFHGHDDTRNAVSNSVSAIKAGAGTVHVTWLGVGERAGNTSVEGILSDLHRRGIKRYDLSHIAEGSALVSEAFKVPIPRNHPLVGDIVFRFESGIHAAAIHKAHQRGMGEVAGIVYSAVDPREVGRNHEVAIGPQGGEHSVRWVLEKMGHEFTTERMRALLTFARGLNRALNEDEITSVIAELDVYKNGNS